MYRRSITDSKSIRCRMSRWVVATAICAFLVLVAGMSNTLDAVGFGVAPASATANNFGAIAEPPYVHRGVLGYGGYFIYGAGSIEGSSSLKRHICVTLYEHNGHTWIPIAQKTATRRGGGNIRVIVSTNDVPKPRYGCYFTTMTEAWTLWPNGWRYDGKTASRGVKLDAKLFPSLY